MATNPYNRFATIDRTVDTAQIDEGLRQHMLRVYNYMLVGLLVTGGVAYFVSTSPAMLQLLFGGPQMYLVMLAPLAFVLVLSFGIQKFSASTAQMIFWVYCGVMGLSLSTIFIAFTGTSIARVFFITSAVFGAMSLYGYTTKRDLSQFGSFLIMGLFGIILASIVNLFIGSSALQFAISVIGVLVFTGLTAWDTQNIKEVYNEAHGAEANQKLAVMGALSLYLNFVNLFILLMQLLGTSRE